MHVGQSLSQLSTLCVTSSLVVRICHQGLRYIGEVEGEIEGSDDQIDELRGARKPRTDERSTHQRGPGKQPWRASPLGRHEKREADNGHDRPSGRHEKREADNGHDSVKNQKRKKRALVCYNCGGKGHPARLCPTPSDHAAHAVDEEGDTEEESSDEGDVCGVEWECELNGTGDEDDDILGMGCDSAEQSKWERLAAVVDMRALDFVKPAERENPQSRSEEVQGSNERRACGGNHVASGGREETAHVSGQDGRSREPCSPRQQGSQDSQTQGRCHSSAEDRERVRRRSLGQERCNQQEAGFSPAGLSPEVCSIDDGQTIRPVRNEGAARERNVVGFDLGGVEDAQEECKVGPHAEEEPNMDCES